MTDQKADKHTPVLPEGIAKNNPFGVLSGDEIEEYGSPAEGLKAGMERLRGYKDAKNEDGSDVTTLRHALQQHAPAETHDVTALGAVISTDTGYSLDDTLNFDSPDALVKIAKSLVNHENGNAELYGYTKGWFSNEDYYKAANEVTDAEEGEDKGDETTKNKASKSWEAEQRTLDTAAAGSAQSDFAAIEAMNGNDGDENVNDKLQNEAIDSPSAGFHPDDEGKNADADKEQDQE